MTKQEVIEGLKCHAGAGGCNECPYEKMHGVNNMTCPQHLALDALNLLKEQEDGIEPKISKEDDGYVWYYCGKCGYEIELLYENYCSMCGTKIKLKENIND